MPRGDRMGPAGMGPMTGRAAGYCTGNAMAGFMNFVPGRRAWPSVSWGYPAYAPLGFRSAFRISLWPRRVFMRGRGWGRGRGHWW